MGFRSNAAVAGSALVMAVAGVVPAAIAQEEASGTGPSPWTPYQGSGFEVAAGEVCDFTLRGELISDKERYRVAETYPDGSTRVEEWTGQLVFRFVNVESGASVRRNLTGRGDFVYHEDGSWSLVNVGGHIGVGLHAGDDPGKGYYVISGAGYELTQDTAGHRTLTPGDGNAENVCETLS